MKVVAIAWTAVGIILVLFIWRNAKNKAMATKPDSPLIITSGFVLPTATVGVEYVVTFQAIGGHKPYAWAIAPIDNYPQFEPLPNGEFHGKFYHYQLPSRTLVVKVGDGNQTNTQAVTIPIVEFTDEQ